MSTPIIKMTDASTMPFGKHKGKKMANVPAAYLLWLWNNRDDTGVGEVWDYIKDNLEDIKIEATQ